MGIVDSQALIGKVIMLHAVAVLELRTVVHGDGLECALGVIFDDFIQGTDSLRAGLGVGTEDNFIAGFAFGQCEY